MLVVSDRFSPPNGHLINMEALRDLSKNTEHSSWTEYRGSWNPFWAVKYNDQFTPAEYATTLDERNHGAMIARAFPTVGNSSHIEFVHTK